MTIFEHRPRPGYPPLDPKRCKASVGHEDRAPTYSQCQRKVWKDGWCRQHHPKIVESRHAARERQWAKERRIDGLKWSIESAERDVVQAAMKYVAKPKVMTALKRAVARLNKLQWELRKVQP